MKALVCGCGPSVYPGLPKYQPDVKIYGVNDCNKWVRPDCLLLLDAPAAFDVHRRRWIIETPAKEVFFLKTARKETQWDFIFPNAQEVTIRHQNEGKDLTVRDPGQLWFRKSSPTAAIWLAFDQGATDIALLGVDIYNHQFLAAGVAEIDRALGAMREHFEARGTRLRTCSPMTPMESLEKIALEEWLEQDANI